MEGGQGFADFGISYKEEVDFKFCRTITFSDWIGDSLISCVELFDGHGEMYFDCGWVVE